MARRRVLLLVARGLAVGSPERAADQREVLPLLLENLNPEPARAEVHYLADTIEECRPSFEQIPSARFGWAFTVNHAHLTPAGIHGFLDAFGVERIGEVRLADNTGEYEVHLRPGEGTIDFGALFRRLETAGCRRHYTMAFGSIEDKVRARDDFARFARGEPREDQRCAGRRISSTATGSSRSGAPRSSSS